MQYLYIVILAAEKKESYADFSKEDLIAALLSKEERIASLEFQLSELKRLVFGSKHERFAPAQSPEQLSLGLGTEEKEPAPKKTLSIEYTRTAPENKKQPRRLALSSRLPREIIVIEPKEDVTGWVAIGKEITEELEYIPGKLFVKQYERPKYARPDGTGIVTGELPPRPIEKGIAGPGLLAQTVIDKYCDHLPLYRQLQRFKREGVTLASSTVADWISQTCTLLFPLYEALKKEILSCNYLQADETPIKVLDKDKKGTTHRGFHWVYHAPVKKLVLFDYREGRGRDGPNELLKNFSGYLQTDGYGVYDQFDGKNGVTLVNCFAHARRKFEKALENDKALAEEALTLIQQLYALEREIKERGIECGIVRTQASALILAELWNWMQANRHKVLPKSLIGEAIHYALSRKKQLSLFLSDEKLLIDNNLIENAIRPVAVGRKNYLFAGSHEGAKRAAMLYSFMGTCKMHQVNPFEWLRDVLSRIPAHHANKLTQLLPHYWKLSNPA
jgi:transposase